MNTAVYVESFIKTVSAWDSIESSRHRFGGTEFKLGKVEVGHIHHHNAMLDIPFTVKLRKALVREGKTGVHHLLHESGWTTFYIRSERDLEQALWLMHLSYLQKLSRRGEIRADDAAAIAMSSEVRKAAFPHTS